MGLAIGLVSGQIAAEPQMATNRFTGPDPIQVITGLLLVLLIIVLCLLILRRYGSFTRMPPRQFQVIGTTSVGTRERVVLLQAGRKQLVLGVSPGRIETLCILEGQDTIQPESGPEPSPPAFLDKLVKAMQQQRS